MCLKKRAHWTFVLVAAAAVAFGGCAYRTTGATNVTSNSATLNGNVSCESGDSGTLYWGWRAVGAGGGGNWTTTKEAAWSCPRGGLTRVPVSTTVKNLTPNTAYEFKLCATSRRFPKGMCVNANGGGNGGDPSNPPQPRSTFTTRAAIATRSVSGLHEIWSDDASNPDPVAAGRWDEIVCQRQNGVQEGTYDTVSKLAPGRFTQVASGGPDGRAYYHWYAPRGDNIWTPGTAGRCELAYPKAQGGIVRFYEGQRRVILLSVRLPANWNLGAQGWRVVSQIKQNEGKQCSASSPALDLEQRSGSWLSTSFGGPTIWSAPAARTGVWLSFALDVTFSTNPSLGRYQVSADLNGDGTYDYTGPQWTGQTLCSGPSGPVESQFMNGLYEGVGGDTLDTGALSIWG